MFTRKLYQKLSTNDCILIALIFFICYDDTRFMETNAVARASEHKHTLVLTKHAQRRVHGDSLVGKFNTLLAICITKIVGSMWCAYIFAALALISLPAAIASRNPLVIVSWIAQTFLQLVLLPIIIVGQNVQAEVSDERAERDHETLMAIHTLTAEIYKLNKQQEKIFEASEKKEKN